MAYSNERVNVAAEMSLLQKQQLESIEQATFCGWTAEAKAHHDKRADRIDLLRRRLTELDETP